MSSECSESLILEKCREVGACAAGICSADGVPSDIIEKYETWLHSGGHGTMEYMERYGDVRKDPRLLLANARSIISMAFYYGRQRGEGRHPLISDYALGRDYHEELKKQLTEVVSTIKELFPESESRICVDTAPMFERYFAQEARVGFIGRNRMLIVPGVGSRVFLAEIITTAALRPTGGMPEGGCGECRKCIEACPGGALSEDMLYSPKCYSYLTIEYRGEALPGCMNLRGRRIYGCDVCNDVCPYNRDEAGIPPKIEGFRPNAELMALNQPEDILMLTPESYKEIFRHSAVRRAKLSQLIRNAAQSLKKGE